MIDYDEDAYSGLPEDAELIFTVEFYQDEDGNLYTVAEGDLPNKALRVATADRLTRIAQSLETFADPDRVH
jgi:hypothetical protein